MENIELLSLSKKQLQYLKKYILNYNNKYREKINLDDKIKFGCEIEFVSNKKLNYFQNKINNNEYKVEYDYSGINIIEVISPILNNSNNNWYEFNRVINCLDGKITNKVGGHIHFDHSIINDDNIINLLKFWYCFEDIIYEYAKGNYKNIRSIYVYYAKKFDDNVVKLIEQYDYNLIDINAFKFLNKDYGLNLWNHLIVSNDKDTYEIRVPNSSLDIKIWQNNIEFFGNMLKFCQYNGDLINKIYKKGKLQNNYKNVLLLNDLIYNDINSKAIFLNTYYGKKKKFDNTKKFILK